jgi:hypothetical protein
MRAADGLDRAIREPVEGNYRRLHVNLLTTRADSAIVKFSSTVAARNPLHIARCGALESAASDHDSFLSIHSLVADSRDDTPRGGSDPERTALRRQARAPDPSTPKFDIVTLPHVACQSSMHRSCTQCCPSIAERAGATGIDVQDG